MSDDDDIRSNISGSTISMNSNNNQQHQPQSTPSIASSDISASTISTVSRPETAALSTVYNMNHPHLPLRPARTVASHTQILAPPEDWLSSQLSNISANDGDNNILTNTEINSYPMQQFDFHRASGDYNPSGNIEVGTSERTLRSKRRSTRSRSRVNYQESECSALSFEQDSNSILSGSTIDDDTAFTLETIEQKEQAGHILNGEEPINEDEEKGIDLSQQQREAEELNQTQGGEEGESEGLEAVQDLSQQQTEDANSYRSAESLTFAYNAQNASVSPYLLQQRKNGNRNNPKNNSRNYKRNVSMINNSNIQVSLGHTSNRVGRSRQRTGFFNRDRKRDRASKRTSSNGSIRSQAATGSAIQSQRNSNRRSASAKSRYQQPSLSEMQRGVPTKVTLSRKRQYWEMAGSENGRDVDPGYKANVISPTFYRQIRTHNKNNSRSQRPQSNNNNNIMQNSRQQRPQSNNNNNMQNSRQQRPQSNNNNNQMARQQRPQSNNNNNQMARPQRYPDPPRPPSPQSNDNNNNVNRVVNSNNNRNMVIHRQNSIPLSRTSNINANGIGNSNNNRSMVVYRQNVNGASTVISDKPPTFHRRKAKRLEKQRDQQKATEALDLNLSQLANIINNGDWSDWDPEQSESDNDAAMNNNSKSDGNGNDNNAAMDNSKSDANRRDNNSNVNSNNIAALGNSDGNKSKQEITNNINLSFDENLNTITIQAKGVATKVVSVEGASEEARDEGSSDNNQDNTSSVLSSNSLATIASPAPSVSPAPSEMSTKTESSTTAVHPASSGTIGSLLQSSAFVKDPNWTSHQTSDRSWFSVLKGNQGRSRYTQQGRSRLRKFKFNKNAKRRSSRSPTTSNVRITSLSPSRAVSPIRNMTKPRILAHYHPYLNRSAQPFFPIVVPTSNGLFSRIRSSNGNGNGNETAYGPLVGNLYQNHALSGTTHYHLHM